MRILVHNIKWKIFFSSMRCGGLKCSVEFLEPFSPSSFSPGVGLPLIKMCLSKENKTKKICHSHPFVFILLFMESGIEFDSNSKLSRENLD